MAIRAPGLAGTVAWQPVLTGDEAVAVAERDALGTSARVAIWPPGNLGIACTAVDGVLAELDEQASRFRAGSQLSWLHRAGGGLFLLGDGLAEAVGVALAAARWTGGLTDPTVGGALIALGYDRDFAAIDPDGGDRPLCRSRHLAGSGWGWTGGCSACRRASGWTWARRRREWAATGRCGRSCRPPGMPAGHWSASVATSPSVARRPAAAGRSPWLTCRMRLALLARSLSG